MNGCQNTLVIGIGNPLRGDDGVGAFIAQRIDERSLPNIQVMTLHQLTPELVPIVAAAARVVFIDAAIDPDQATPRCEPLAIGDRGAGLTHRIEPGRICALAEAIYGFAPEAYVVTVPIRAAGFGDGLSADARRQAEAAVEVVLALIGKADAVAVSPVMDSERSVRNRRWPAV